MSFNTEPAIEGNSVDITVNEYSFNLYGPYKKVVGQRSFLAKPESSDSKPFYSNERNFFNKSAVV